MPTCVCQKSPWVSFHLKRLAISGERRMKEVARVEINRPCRHLDTFSPTSSSIPDSFSPMLFLHAAARRWLKCHKVVKMVPKIMLMDADTKTDIGGIRLLERLISLPWKISNGNILSGKDVFDVVWNRNSPAAANGKLGLGFAPPDVSWRDQVSERQSWCISSHLQWTLHRMRCSAVLRVPPLGLCLVDDTCFALCYDFQSFVFDAVSFFAAAFGMRRSRGKPVEEFK